MIETKKKFERVFLGPKWGYDTYFLKENDVGLHMYAIYMIK